jgi:hypothetical protein
MELNELFEKVNELTGKFPNLNKEEAKELMKLSRNLSAEMSNALYDWDRI